jgi:DNA-binding NarL/FixJ family response regulator
MSSVQTDALSSRERATPIWDAATKSPSAKAPSSEFAVASIVLIERRVLIRDCLTQCFKLSAEPNVISFPTLEKWLEVSAKCPASLIVLCVAGRCRDEHIEREIALLAQMEQHVPTVLLSDAEDLEQIVDALDQGARGYIPTSLPLEVAVEAMRLVKAGGVYVPASSVVAAQRSTEVSASARTFCNGIFTARQAAVVEALRRGKANKIIAYELKMRESTVKVHVRAIMKKLKARNRTEVAFLANGLMGEDSRLSGADRT